MICLTLSWGQGMKVYEEDLLPGFLKGTGPARRQEREFRFSPSRSLNATGFDSMFNYHQNLSRIYIEPLQSRSISLLQASTYDFCFRPRPLHSPQARSSSAFSSFSLCTLSRSLRSLSQFSSRLFSSLRVVLVDVLFLGDGVNVALRMGIREARGDSWGVDLVETSGEAFGGDDELDVGPWDGDMVEALLVMPSSLLLVLDF